MRAWSQPLQTVWRSPVLRDNLGLADVTGIAWHPDGRRLAILTTFSTRMAVLEVGTDRVLATAHKGSGMSSDFLAYSADGSQIVAPSWTTEAEFGHNVLFSVLDSRTLQVVRHVAEPNRAPPPPNTTNASRLIAITADKTRVATVFFGRLDSIGVFDTSNWQPVVVLTGRQYLALSLALSADGSRLAMGGFGTITTASLPSGTIEHAVKAYDIGASTPAIDILQFVTPGRLVSGIRGVAIGPGVEAAPDTAAAHHPIMVWRAQDMRLAAQTDSEVATPSHMAVHPSLPLAAITTRAALFMVDLRTGSIRNRLTYDTLELNSVAFSPDGSKLAAGLVGGLQILSSPSA